MSPAPESGTSRMRSAPKEAVDTREGLSYFVRGVEVGSPGGRFSSARPDSVVSRYHHRLGDRMAVSTGQEEKKKALNLAIAQIEKSCGKGSIMKMGADSAKVRIDVIPTG